MPIIRGPRPSDEFAMIANEILQDSRLSFRARGLAASVLSRAPGWSTDARTLAKHAKEGRDAILSALRELEEAGYSFLHTYRVEGGKFTRDRYLFDRRIDAEVFARTMAQDPRLGPATTEVRPSPGNPSSVPSPENPAPADPAPAGPAPDNQDI